MADERHEGLMCPACGAQDALRVKWTVYKSPLLRRYVYKCKVCGAAVKGYMEIDEVVSEEAKQKLLYSQLHKDERLEKEKARWCTLL